MYLIESFTISLVAAIAAMMLLGGWIITYKTAKWRFELYYIDFILGFVFVSVLAFATAGTFASGITSLDNLGIVRMRLILSGLAAGGLASLGAILQLALASLSGIALSLLITTSIGLFVNYLLFVFVIGHGNPVLALGAAFLALTAGGLSLFAYSAHAAEFNAALVARNAAADAHGKPVDPATPPRTLLSGIILGVSGGVTLGFLSYAIRLAHMGDIELQPYPIALLTAVGALLSAPVYEVFAFSLSLGSHRAARPARYFKGTSQQHLNSVGGGLLFGFGYLLLLLAMHAATPEVSVRRVHAMVFLYAAGIPAAFYAIVALREQQSSRGLIFIYLSILFLGAALGLALIAA